MFHGPIEIGIIFIHMDYSKKIDGIRSLLSVTFWYPFSHLYTLFILEMTS